MNLRQVFIVVLAATGWLAGCATLGQEGNLPAKKALIGKTSQEVLACAGKPLSEGMEGDEKTATYYRDSKANEDSFSGSKSSVIGVRHGCAAELHFRDGRVAAVEYQPSVRGGIEHCEEIFAQCL
jgi:hypothetical protein